MRALFDGPMPFVILLVVLLLFGAPRLPALAKSLGQSMKILRAEVKSDDSKPASDETTTNSDTK